MSENLDEIGKKPDRFVEKEAKKEGIDLFFGDAEATFFIEAGREITEKIVQESFLLYRVDLERTRTHSLYGEAKKKVWHPESRVYGRINVEALDPSYHVTGGLAKKGMGMLTAHVYLEHLEELGLMEERDGNQVVLKIKLGDFLGFKNQYYKVTNDGYSQIANEFSWAGDRRFYVTIKAVEIDEDVFKAR